VLGVLDTNVTRTSELTRRTVVLGACLFLVGCTGQDDESGDDQSEDDEQTQGDDDPPEEGTQEDSTPQEGNGDTETEGTPDKSTNPATGDVEQGELRLTSPAFDDGEQNPTKYGYTEGNVNPPLKIENVPENAASLALVVDDPDAVEPAGKVWDHWVVWNIPPSRTEIPEGWEPTEAMEGTNDYDEVGYGGPNPPDEEHRYRFKLFALETTLDLPVETDSEALGEAIAGHVLARTQLDGTYPA